MLAVDLIGVPFDGWGRRGAQARAAAALRHAGLGEAFGDRPVALQPEPLLPEPSPRRAPRSGLMNEAALLAMVDAVHGRVSASLSAGRFPLVYGGDCTVLLGAIPALRDAVGETGLLSLDGHEDTTPLDASPDGEAANMEIGLLLGLTGHLAPEPLRARLPGLTAATLAMLGLRDEALRRERNVASLVDRGFLVRGHAQTAADPAGSGAEAAAHLRAATSAWWLHVDVDVLAQDELAAQRVPGDVDEEGGLTWPQLTELALTALGAGGCRGASIAIYDPDQDPDGGDARRIVEFVAELAPALP